MSNINDFVIVNGVLKQYTGNDVEVVVPEEVTEIGRMGLARCSASKIVLPEGLTTIGEQAFASSANLTEVVIPTSVTSIGAGAFNNCSNLLSVIIPAGVTCINLLTFGGCASLKSVELPQGILNIGSKAFANCTSLAEIHIPDGATNIDELAFGGCTNLTSVSLPDTLLSIGGERGAFFGCNNLKYNEYDNAYYLGNDANNYSVLVSAKESDIKSCEIHKETKLIGSPAFNGCTCLKGIAIPEGVKSLGDNAFNGCVEFDSITLPESLVNIGNFVFFYCIKLKNIIIPDGVKSIGDSAFFNCYGLSTVTIGAGVDAVGKKAFMPQVQFVLSDKFCRKETILPQFMPYLVCCDSMDYAFVWMNQSGKKWEEWFADKKFDADSVLESIVELLSQNEQIAKKEYKRATDFVTKFNVTNDETLKNLASKVAKK